MSGIMRAPGGGFATIKIPYSGELAIGDSILVVEPTAGVATAMAYYRSTGWDSNFNAVDVVDSGNLITITYDNMYGDKAAFIPGPNH